MSHFCARLLFISNKVISIATCPLQDFPAIVGHIELC